MSKELQFLMYNTPEENVSVNVVIKDETIWLTQKAMAELFDCTTDNISLRLKKISMQMVSLMKVQLPRNSR